MESPSAKYKVKNTFKGIKGIAVSWCVVAGVILLVERFSVWFYLPALFVLANRFLALSLYGHEGVHGNLSSNIWFNNFLGRYFCAFPTLTSFSRYKNKHLMHHQFLGSQGDPDLGLYKDYPVKKRTYFLRALKDTLSGKMIYEFFNYYSDIPDLLTRKPVLKSHSVFARSDLPEFILFNIILLSLLIWSGLYMEYFWYWIVPLLVCVPYFQLIGALQHAPGKYQEEHYFDSRSITGPKWLMALLLPVDINFHSTHHLNPGIPHYHLRQLTEELHGQDTRHWQQSYAEALRMIFTK